MPKQIILIGLNELVGYKISCQNNAPQFDSHHKNIYAEFLGSHLLVGVNYDMRLKKGSMDGIGLD